MSPVKLMTDFDDPELIRKAKELAAGPLGDQMSKFPMRFAAAAFIGPTLRSRPLKLRNGTATLLRLQGRPIAVTCAHVVDGFRELPADSEPGFWIGNLQIDLSARLIAESRRLDVAVIDLTGLDLNYISNGHEIGSSLFEPGAWPPESPKPGDFISFGGFPGKLRDQVEIDEILFKSFSLGASEVTTVGETHIACQLNREYWVSARGDRHHNLHEFGGMSGGPAFIWRGLRAEFVGIIYQHAPGLDVVRIRSAHVINADGTIE